MKRFVFLLCAIFLTGCNHSTTTPDMCPGQVRYNTTCYPQEILQAWGLGSTETTYFSTERPYDWYLDQADTGQHADSNCGPAVAVMVTRWRTAASHYTVERILATHPLVDSTWYTTNMQAFFHDAGIPFTLKTFISTDQFIQAIQSGHLVIICLRMKYVRFNPVEHERVNRFYAYETGHFLILKGVRVVDGVTWFEAYDPASNGVTYTDGTPKGKNRHYRADDLTRAIEQWWPAFFEIAP